MKVPCDNYLILILTIINELISKNLDDTEDTRTVDIVNMRILKQIIREDLQ